VVTVLDKIDEHIQRTGAEGDHDAISAKLIQI
jgi:hypothetical protein